MIPDFSGDYLKYDGTEDGDIITIVDEGKMEFSEKLGKTMFNLKVSRNDKILTYSPSNTAGTQMQLAWGKDSANWVGQKFSILHVDKKMLIRPIKPTKA
jgi:hypothetical protein